MKSYIICLCLKASYFTPPSQVNHHFQQNNSHRRPLEHPRWGLVIGVVASIPIRGGQELHTHYGYTPAVFPSDFPWYWELKSHTEKED